MTRKLIIDCDPGQDDAINLFLALPPTDDYEVLGITVVAGNVGLDKVSRNARLLCELTGRTDIPVYEGYAEPLKLPLVTAEEVHSREGLEGVELFEPTKKRRKSTQWTSLSKRLLRRMTPPSRWSRLGR